MKNIWQKQKSKSEIDEAVSNRDLTGGYNFLPWLWYMRKFLVIVIMLDLFIGYKLFKTYNEYQETITGLSAIFFGLIGPAAIMTLLVREYKNKKKGISQ
jgi:hypothetical protein